ncbi:hypothetical protein E4U55_004986, partial [Claviceps digitariae]
SLSSPRLTLVAAVPPSSRPRDSASVAPAPSWPSCMTNTNTTTTTTSPPPIRFSSRRVIGRYAVQGDSDDEDLTPAAPDELEL